MRYLTFVDESELKSTTAVLIKTSYFNKGELLSHYINPLEELGISKDSIIAFDLLYENNKITASKAKKYLEGLLRALTKLGVSNILVCDATYFKVLTGLNKADSHIGYINPCKIRGFEHFNVCYALNYAVFLRNPNQVSRLDLALKTLADHIKGTLRPLGQGVVHSEEYFDSPTIEELEMVLESLYRHPMLVCDIETYDLHLVNAGLGSIGFAWTEHDGMTIHLNHQVNKPMNDKYRSTLKRFFERYTGILIFHNCTFDIKNLIYTLFMEHPLDHRGMLHGLHTMFRSVHDTKIIAYLATNSTAGNELGLKPLSHPYMGNYAEDVSDITKLSTERLLEYNLKDCLATFWLFKQYFPKLLADDQLGIYEDIMMPSAKLITQMELHGMPINMEEVHKAAHDLQTTKDQGLSIILNNAYTKKALYQIQLEELDKINSKLKTKQHTFEKVEDMVFNPGSPIQLQTLLYDILGLPVLDLTPTKNPATGAGTIEKLINHAEDPEVVELLEALISLNKVDKILSTFIPAFLASQPKGDWHYLHGSFNLGGALSGRMSSSKINLQQLPSSGEMGKIVKKCFSAKPGWIFCGADFSSLEDRINTLLTKDVNKMRVYIDQYDGHCLRAYYYWKELLPWVRQVDDTVECYNINGQVFTEDDLIEYRGETYNAKQFYTKFCNTYPIKTIRMG